MDRVVIVGCPGAGKSTVARRLSEITDLPLIHLDQHYWLPGWIRPDDKAWRQKVHELTSHPRWIIDGNYGSSMEIRLAAADTLIHLDFSTPICTWRVVRRTLAGLGKQRGQELRDGCPERIDWSFLQFVLAYRSRHRFRDIERMATFDGVMHRFTSPKTLHSFLEEFENNSYSH